MLTAATGATIGLLLMMLLGYYLGTYATTPPVQWWKDPFVRLAMVEGAIIGGVIGFSIHNGTFHLHCC